MIQEMLRLDDQPVAEILLEKIVRNLQDFDEADAVHDDEYYRAMVIKNALKEYLKNSSMTISDLGSDDLKEYKKFLRD